MGAAISPTTVSKGGLLGAKGWLREGTNAFVRPNDFAMDSASLASSAVSSAGRSSVSSSLICIERDSIRDLIVGINSGEPALRFWKILSFSLTCRRVSKTGRLVVDTKRNRPPDVLLYPSLQNRVLCFPEASPERGKQLVLLQLSDGQAPRRIDSAIS